MVIEEILMTKHNWLFNKSTNVIEGSINWIKEVEENYSGDIKNVLLAIIYGMRANSSLDFDEAIKASEYYEKIPFQFYTEELVISYVNVLKLCYKYDRVIEVLEKVLETSPWFALECFCLNNLIDYSMVVDGAITKEDYQSYKHQYIEFLNKEKMAADS